MSISKTRQLLVDVARQLFAKKGLENTTMNDIAVASGKGRRTLYTYFADARHAVGGRADAGDLLTVFQQIGQILCELADLGQLEVHLRADRIERNCALDSRLRVTGSARVHQRVGIELQIVREIERSAVIAGFLRIKLPEHMIFKRIAERIPLSRLLLEMLRDFV